MLIAARRVVALRVAARRVAAPVVRALALDAVQHPVVVEFISAIDDA